MRKESLDQRATKARKRAELTQAEAAKKIGCSRATVAMWESGQSSEISGSYLLPAARAYKVHPEWLSMASDDDRYPWDGAPLPVRAYDVDGVDDHHGLSEDYTAIEHLDADISAGPGSEPTFVQTQYPMIYRMGWFHRHGLQPKDVKSMRVQGASMERTLFDGDRIAISLKHNLVQNDGVYVIQLDGLWIVKRLFRHGLGGYRIVSDNDDKVRYPDIIVPPEESGRVYVLGRVIDKSGKGGL